MCLLKGFGEISREKDGNGEGSRSDRPGTSADTEVVEVYVYFVVIVPYAIVCNFCVW